MKPVNKITPDDIKKISKMTNEEIEAKLRGIMASSEGGIKKMLSKVDVDGLRKQIQTKSAADISKLMSNLEKLDPGLLGKIKNSLK